MAIVSKRLHEAIVDLAQEFRSHPTHVRILSAQDSGRLPVVGTHRSVVDRIFRAFVNSRQQWAQLFGVIASNEKGDFGHFLAGLAQRNRDVHAQLSGKLHSLDIMPVFNLNWQQGLKSGSHMHIDSCLFKVWRQNKLDILEEKRPMKSSPTMVGKLCRKSLLSYYIFSLFKDYHTSRYDLVELVANYDSRAVLIGALASCTVGSIFLDIAKKELPEESLLFTTFITECAADLTLHLEQLAEETIITDDDLANWAQSYKKFVKLEINRFSALYVPLIDHQSVFNIYTNKYRSIPMPYFKTLFENLRNPWEDCADREKWMSQMKSVANMSDARWAEMAKVTDVVPMFHPFVVDKQRYEVLFKMYLIFFICDDQFEKIGYDLNRNVDNNYVQLCDDFWLKQMCQTLDKVQDPDNYVSMIGWRSYALMNYACLSDICRQLNRTQVNRLCKHLREFYHANYDECVLMAENQLMSKPLDELIEVRRQCAAIFVSICLNEFGCELCLTEEEWDRPDVQRVVYLGSLIVAVVNDVYSFEKEYNDQNRVLAEIFNVVAFLAMRRCQGDIPAAIHLVLAWATQLEQELMTHLQAIEADPNASNDVKLFCKYCTLVVGGNMTFSFQTDRYNVFSVKTKSLSAQYFG